MNITCSFCYYLINFYVKYIPGSIYTNQIVNSLSEVVANAFALAVVNKFGIKSGFAISYLACALACILVMVSTDGILIPIGVLGAKASITIAFTFLYFSMVNYFDSAFLGFVMGISNVVGRLSTILAPVIAEMPDPIPMMSTMILCFGALVCCLMLQQPNNLNAKN